VIFYHPQLVCVFLHLNNSSGNKWFNFKIPSRSVYTIIPFPSCFLMGHLRPIVLEFLSCFGPRASIWLIVQLIFPAFQLSSLFFCTSLWTRLGPPHPSIKSIPRCVWTHPIDLMGIHLLHCVHGNERIRTMLQFTTPLPPLHEMLVSTWDKNNYMRFLQPHSIPFIDELTLCLPKMAFALNQHCHCWHNVSRFTSPILHNSRICFLQCSSSQGKELLQSTPR